MSSATGFMVRPKNDGVAFSAPQQVWYVTNGYVDLTVNCARGQFFIALRTQLDQQGVVTEGAETVVMFDPIRGTWMRELISEV